MPGTPQPLGGSVTERFTRAGLLSESIEAACRRWSSRPAITFGDHTITYCDLWTQIQTLAEAYRQLGIATGDRIVCQLPNRPEHVVAIGAAWACGAVHVGTDNDLTGRELAWIVAHTEASGLLFEPRPSSSDPLAPARAVRQARPDTRIILAGRHDDAPGMYPLAELLSAPPGSTGATNTPPGPDGTALLLLTSGTTGKPKAVMETLPGCWAKTQFFADAVLPGTDDVHLLYLPIAHVFGLRLALMALLTGGRLVLLDRFSPEGALGLVAQEAVTVLPGMPTHFRLLLDRLDPERHDVSSLRWAISAAAPLPRALGYDIYDRLKAQILYVYGCSENFATRTTDRDEILRGSVGRVVFKGPSGTPPDGSIDVFSAEGDTPLPRGEVGEIAFGASCPVRYWGAPDAAIDGWYRTGDLGRIDADGRVYLHGRLKELVNRGGLKVSPSEIENAILRHRKVADAAVVATPDPVLGEAICACVVPVSEELDWPGLAEIRTFLSSSIARHKLPDELCVVDRIPRTKIGKVERAALTALVVSNGVKRERLRPR